METHYMHPELWFRPSPTLPFEVLSESIGSKTRKETIRLGKRDLSHPKGYAPGMTVTLRLFDDLGAEQVRMQVRIERIKSLPLAEFPEWRTLQKDLSYFEGTPIEAGTIATLVSFTYLS